MAMDSVRRVEALAEHLLDFAGVQRPPTPLSLIHAVGDVRLLYGDCRYHQGFLLQRGRVFYIVVNGNDCEGERRFTVFHELFHVIERVQPAFYQVATADWHSELLADHFALSILLSNRWFAAEARACDNDLGELASECGVTPSAVLQKLSTLRGSS
jgi:Zn-dependent peptidase ImmA (M78 family)